MAEGWCSGNMAPRVAPRKGRRRKITKRSRADPWSAQIRGARGSRRQRRRALTRYVPELRRVHDPYGRLDEITIRMLLNHTARW